VFAGIEPRPKQHAPQAIASAISNSKSKTISAADYAKRSPQLFRGSGGRVYERYELLLNQSKALDFDDLLMKTVLLFRKHPEVLANTRKDIFT